jgi:hypothetical protein
MISLQISRIKRAKSSRMMRRRVPSIIRGNRNYNPWNVYQGIAVLLAREDIPLGIHVCSTFCSTICCAHAGLTDIVGTFRGISTSVCFGWGLSIQTSFTPQVPHRIFDIALQLNQSIDKSGISPQNGTCFAFCTSNFSSNHMTNEWNRLALPIYVQPRSLHLCWSYHELSAFFRAVEYQV